MIRAVKRLFTLLLLSMFSLTASAVVLEQAPLDNGDGYLSKRLAGTTIAEDFRFTTDVTLTSISWWGSYVDSAPDPESFTVRIFEDDGAGNPASTSLYETMFAESGNDSGLVDLFGVTVFQYDVSVSSWLLQSGVNYYLSVFSNDDSQEWYWLESSVGDSLIWSRAADGDPWSAESEALNMSFRLTADQATTNVPEPATLFLLLLPSLWLIRKFHK